MKNWEDYEGRLAQVVEFYKDSDSPEKRKKSYRNQGCCKAVLIDTEFGDDADDNIFYQLSGESSVKMLLDKEKKT